MAAFTAGEPVLGLAAPAKLAYFGLKAAAFPAICVLEIGGVEYEAVKVDFPDWGAMKPTTPTGVLPVATMADGTTLVESMAIARACAAACGTLGEGKDFLTSEMLLGLNADLNKEAAKVCPTVFTAKDFDAAKHAAFPEGRDKVLKHLAKYTQFLLEGGDRFTAGGVTLGEVDLFTKLYQFSNGAIPEVVAGPLAAFYARVSAIPAVKKVADGESRWGPLADYFCPLPPAPAPAPITLNYWPGRGLMEVPRCMLAIAGKEYRDERVTGTADKGAALDANLGRVPLLECADGAVGQSAAINFYTASECGLMGGSTFETAQVIAFTEHIKELNSAYRAACPFGTEPVAATMADFFENAEADDVTGPAARGRPRKLRWFLGRMEKLVGDDGFAVGGKLSLADVMLYNLLADTLPAETHPETPAWKLEPLTNKAAVDAALTACPKLSACIASVATHPGIVAWMASRGPQGF